MRSRFATVLVALVCAGVALPGIAVARVAASEFATELPFKSCEGLICIDVALDGAVPRTLMLDTGNVNATVITDTAKELGWTLQPAQRDDASVPGIYLGGEHNARLGNVQVSMPFFVFDRALLGEYKPPVDGSITYGFFKDRVLEIDYARHRLRISGVIATPVEEKPASLGKLSATSFGMHGPPILVGSGFSVNGKPVRAQIDTVFTGTMLIYDSAIDTLGLHQQGTPELFRYTDGGVNLLSSHADSIRFGTHDLLGKSPPLYFVGDGKNPVHQPDGMFEATAGNALFAGSVVTLDFHNMTVDVRPAQ